MPREKKVVDRSLVYDPSVGKDVRAPWFDKNQVAVDNITTVKRGGATKKVITSSNNGSTKKVINKPGKESKERNVGIVGKLRLKKV
jgi:hypothetical protein